MTTKITNAAQSWWTTVTVAVLALMSGPADSDASTDESERGDVPGWVMITVMTAIVVIALLGVFRTQVLTAVTNAFQSVSGAG